MVAVALNENRVIDRRVVGDERTPVIKIDDVVTSTELLRSQACDQGHFVLDHRVAYPGVRSPLPDAYIDVVTAELIPILRTTYDVPANLKPRLLHHLFSLVTTPPEDLATLQRVPHFDSLNEYYFATVHFLSPGHFGGTGIFRHQPTGFERITQARYEDYVQAAERHMKTNGLPPPEYIAASTDHYELIEELEYQTNRLIAYPGSLLHSGLIDPDRDISWDPAQGRLTANLFIDFVEAESP